MRMTIRSKKGQTLGGREEGQPSLKGEERMGEEWKEQQGGGVGAIDLGWIYQVWER